MRISHAFRPSVVAMEARCLPSSGAVDAAFAATGQYADAARLGLHREYVAEADKGPGRLVFLGDSITYKWGDVDRVDAGSTRWAATFAPLGARNFGVIGDQTENLLWRVEDGELDGQPKVAVVLIGINDIIGGRSASETAGHITSVVRAIRQETPGTKVLVVGILPTASPSFNLSATKINALVARQARGPGVQTIDASRGFLHRNGKVVAGLYDGGVHLSAAGYDVLARTLAGSVRRLLRG